MNFTVHEYFTQFEILKTVRINEKTQISRLKMLLYNKFSKYPKYVCCKEIKMRDNLGSKEAKNTKKICGTSHRGLIKYYYHIKSEDATYIFIEDCFDYSSGFHRIDSLAKNLEGSTNEIKFSEVNEHMIRNFLKSTDRLINAVKKIHFLGFIHCDIAPKNILISKDKNYKIADFGSLAKKYSKLNSFTEIYLSKENRLALEKNWVQATEAIDYYALGKSIFELLVLENNLDFMKLGNNTTDIKYIYETIQRKELNQIYADIIYDVMKNSYKGKKYYLKLLIARANIKTNLLYTLQISSGYCCKCKFNIVSNDLNSIVFGCKHSFHESCLNNEKFFKCEVCLRFIGSKAYRELLYKNA